MMKKFTIILTALAILAGCDSNRTVPDTPEPEPQSDTLNPGPAQPDTLDPAPATPDTVAYEFKQDLGQILTSSMIVFKSEPDDNGFAMQGFGFDNDANIYVSDGFKSDSAGNYCRVRQFDKEGSLLSVMKLPSSAHGDGFDVEPAGEDVNIWTSVTVGNGVGGFKGVIASNASIRLIAKFIYKGGATAYAEDAAELFYIGDNGARYVDVDMDHGLFAATSYIDEQKRVLVYSLDDMRKAPLKEIDVTRSTAASGTKVNAYDLTQIEPVADFAFVQEDYTGYEVDGTTVRAIQGFCVYGDRVYFTAGFKEDDNIITVVDYTGAKIVDKQTMGIVRNVSSLKNYGLSSTGEVETEGVDIRKGQMYIGLHGAHYVESIIKLRD